MRASHGHTFFLSEKEKILYPVESLESTVRKLDSKPNITAEEINQMFKERLYRKIM